MSEGVLAEQASYYRRRAAEYDATAYGDPTAALTRIAGIVASVGVSGAVLEIACGTGMWTGALASSAESVLAIDAVPEALELARSRVPAENVTFEVADIFTWAAPTTFDVIFFSAWLSHVPNSHFEPFWLSLRAMLADGGRVVFIDEPVDVSAKEHFVPDAEGVVERVLEDGSRFHIVKNFVDPDRLIQRLGSLGWECRIAREGDDWVRGEAQPTSSARAEHAAVRGW